jgi:CheY-like chemotaxis protein
MAKILSIEDNPELQELIAVTMRSEAHEVHQALDGLKGLEMAKAVIPDVVLLDMMMPQMNGLQVIRELKADPRLKDVPVIIMTAFYSDVEFLEQTLREAGAVEYLRKPIKLDDLLSTVRGALARRA